MTDVRYSANAAEIRPAYPQAFTRGDLDALGRFLTGANRVIALRDVVAGDTSPNAIAMRHDVDHNIDHALTFARWEHEHGFRSSYFLLHSAWYYADFVELIAKAHELVALGHEVGLHGNAVGVARDFGPDPDHARAGRILSYELGRLRGAGLEVIGTAAHGDIRTSRYQRDDGTDVHNNDLYAAQQPHITKTPGPYELSDFGLSYEAYFLHADVGHYISESGGRWSGALEHIEGKQTHLLVHPCHWNLDA